jgi:hypothetical protein
VGAVHGVRVDLSGLRAENLLAETDALGPALDVLREGAARRAPKLTGWLAESVKAHKISTMGAVTSDLIYSRKREQRSWQKHPHGGEAHFIERAFEEDMPAALDALIDRMTSGA